MVHVTRSSRKRKRESGNTIAENKEESLEEFRLSQEKIFSNGWDAFREEYTESVEQLPLALCRNFTLLAQLDIETKAHSSSLFPTIRRYLKMRREISALDISSSAMNAGTNVRSGASRSVSSDVHPSDRLVEMAALINDMLRAADEKVNLAKATYDSVDRHVRLLDQAIQEHENRFSEAIPQATTAAENFSSSSSWNGRAGHPTDLWWHDPGQLLATPRSMRNKKPPDGSVISRHGSLGGLQARRPYLDSEMPVDPHEPTYCVCDQVSYGNMIACDNADCEREWFHLGCVGLTEVPNKVQWFCEACQKKTKSRRSMSRRRR